MDEYLNNLKMAQEELEKLKEEAFDCMDKGKGIPEKIKLIINDKEFAISTCANVYECLSHMLKTEISDFE